jgi:hypothetical protein
VGGYPNPNRTAGRATGSRTGPGGLPGRLHGDDSPVSHGTVARRRGTSVFSREPARSSSPPH